MTTSLRWVVTGLLTAGGTWSAGLASADVIHLVNGAAIEVEAWRDVGDAVEFARGGGIVILVGGLLSTLSALNATIYSSSRVAFAMARDANLPPRIGAVHARRATPHLAILLSALIIIGMAVALPIEDVAAAADVMFLLLFMQVNIAVIRLRRLRPDLERGFRVPWIPVVPVVAILTMLVLTVGKVFLHDLWELGSLYRVGSIVGLAVALLGVSFLTQRFVLPKEER